MAKETKKDAATEANKDKDKDNEKDKNAEGTEDSPKEGAKEGGWKRKKLLIIGIPVLIIVLAGIGAGLYFTGIIGKKHKTEIKNDKAKDNKQATPPANQEVFMDLDEFIVNLDNGDKQTRFLKMQVTLELKNQELATKVQAKMPIIRDNFEIYLRELRPEDLQGSEGAYRLKEELLLRINKILYPDKVTDVLFKEIIVQ